jgi:hypothetical protein
VTTWKPCPIVVSSKIVRIRSCTQISRRRRLILTYSEYLLPGTVPYWTVLLLINKLTANADADLLLEKPIQRYIRSKYHRAFRTAKFRRLLKARRDKADSQTKRVPVCVLSWILGYHIEYDHWCFAAFILREHGRGGRCAAAGSTSLIAYHISNSSTAYIELLAVQYRSSRNTVRWHSCSGSVARKVKKFWQVVPHVASIWCRRANLHCSRGLAWGMLAPQPWALTVCLSVRLEQTIPLRISGARAKKRTRNKLR